jgi:gamma-glutamylcyclotransferase (GGCT)/AIG2-like uncharacterized protein YtfP
MLYFGYASNMDETQMARLCPGAKLVDGAVLEDHGFVITAKGYANVVPSPGDVVFGLLWDITPDHVDSLDQFEGVRPGLYRKVEVGLTTTLGKTVRALVYLASERTTGTPQPGYMEQVVAAARRHRLPEDYVRRLESW